MYQWGRSRRGSHGVADHTPRPASRTLGRPGRCAPAGRGIGTRVGPRPPLAHPRGALREPARDRDRQHDRQRRASHARSATSARASPASSGWSTRTRSCSPGFLLTFGALGDRFGRKGALTVGLVIFGVASTAAAFSERREPARRRPRGDGPRRRADHAGDAVDHHQRLHRRRVSARSRSASGRASPAWPSRSAPSPAGSCSSTSGGVGVHRERADRGRRAGRRPLPRARRRAAPKRCRSTGSARRCPSSGWSRWCGAIIEAPTDGWTSAPILGAFAIAVLALTAFVAWERRVEHPMLDVRFFRNPRFTAASLTVTLVFFALIGFVFLATQYLQFVLGYTPLAGRHPHAAVRGRDDDRRAVVVEARRVGRARSASSSPAC